MRVYKHIGLQPARRLRAGMALVDIAELPTPVNVIPAQAEIHQYIPRAARLIAAV